MKISRRTQHIIIKMGGGQRKPVPTPLADARESFGSILCQVNYIDISEKETKRPAAGEE